LNSAVCQYGAAHHAHLTIELLCR